MCILFLAIEQHPEYPLIICANRDEFHDRPTAPSGFWSSAPELLAGQDLQAGGTWMGVTKGGRFSALTNVRDPHKNNPDAVSRGALVKDFLLSDVGNSEYLQHIRARRDDFNGYNLIFGEWQELWVYNNHLDQCQPLTAGFHGLSNANLNSPWPKINRGVAGMRDYLSDPSEVDDQQLLSLLKDATQADDMLLPNTGVPLEWERRLSSIFIQSPEYGTRTSTIMKINYSGELFWHEVTFSSDGQATAQKIYQLSLK